MCDDVAIIRRVQKHIDHIVRQRLCLVVAGFELCVRRMGSREYGCDWETSDLDLYLIVPDEWLSHTNAIRMMLAQALEDSGEAVDGSDGPVDQVDNLTLKWTSTIRKVDVSLLVAGQRYITNVVSATKCLAFCFDADEVVRRTVRDTLGQLRTAGVLNSHGRKESVKQSLKTAAAALL